MECKEEQMLNVALFSYARNELDKILMFSITKFSQFLKLKLSNFGAWPQECN